MAFHGLSTMWARASLGVSIAALGLAALVWFAVRAVYAQSLVLNVDEAHFAACAVRLLDTGEWPLVGCRDNKPAGVFLSYMVAFQWAGAYEMFAVRLMCGGAVLLSAILLFVLARHLFGLIAANWSTAAFLFGHSVTANLVACKTEALATLPIALGLLSLGLAMTRGKWQWSFSAGACFAIATWFKQPLVLYWPAAAVAFSLALVVSRSAAWSSAIGQVFALSAGAAAAGLPGLIAYYATGHWSEVIFQLFTYPSYYMAFQDVSPIRRLFRIVTYTDEYSRTLLLGGLTGIVGVALAGVVVMRWSLQRSGPPPSEGLWILIVVGTAAFTAITLGAELYQAYFLMILPISALATGYLFSFTDEDGRQEGQEWRPSAARNALILTGVVAALSTAVVALTEPIKRLVDDQAKGVVQTVGARINDLGGAGEYGFVWGYYPTLYVQTGLKPATRYVLADILVGSFSEGARRVDADQRRRFAEPGGWDSLRRDFEHTPPRFIVDASDTEFFGMGSFPVSRQPVLKSWIDTRCHRDGNYAVVETGRNVVTLYVCS